MSIFCAQMPPASRAFLICAVLACLSVQSPEAATLYPLYAGGSALAPSVYRDVLNCYGALVGVPPTVCPTPTVPNQEVLYAPVGNRHGQAGFLNNDPTATGFGTPAITTAIPYTSSDFPAYPYPAVDFAASDLPLTATQITTYNSTVVSDSNSVSFNGATAASIAGPAMQFPGFATSITIPFNPGGLAVNPANAALIANASEATSNLLLSTASLCGIFTGHITDWSDPSLTNDNGGVPLVSSPTPINVVVRLDGTGASFIFSQFLTDNCGAVGYPFSGGISDFPNWSQIPAADLVTASGADGERNAVNGTFYAIGYVNPDHSAPYDPDSRANPTANIESFSSIDAARGAPFVAPSPNSTLLAMATTVPPSFAGSPAPAQDPNNWAAAGQNPTPPNSGAYPIVGFSWLLAYTCYGTGKANPDPLAGSNVKGLFNWYVNQGSGKIRAILMSRGFAPLPSGIGHNWGNAVYQLTNTFGPTHVSIPGAAGTACAGVTAGVKG